MRFTKKVFECASIRGVAEYVLYEIGPNEYTRDYATRLTMLSMRMRKLYIKIG